MSRIQLENASENYSFVADAILSSSTHINCERKVKWMMKRKLCKVNWFRAMSLLCGSSASSRNQQQPTKIAKTKRRKSRMRNNDMPKWRREEAERERERTEKFHERHQQRCRIRHSTTIIIHLAACGKRQKHKWKSQDGNELDVHSCRVRAVSCYVRNRESRAKSKCLLFHLSSSSLST